VSFRLRLLALVVLVAATAVGATAYLAFWQASRQVNASATASEETRTGIVGSLVDFARVNATWDGVEANVDRLAATTGLRIRLVTATGEVVVDTDAARGREPRPPVGPPILVDPRPVFALPDGGPAQPWEEVALRQVVLYRQGVALAGCLRRAGVGVTVAENEYGVPEYAPGPGAPADRRNQINRCLAEAERLDLTPAERREARDCAPTPLAACLETLFHRYTAAVAPPPLRLYLGVSGEPGATLAPGPVVAAAALVIALTVAATVLLSRRVVRPIATLTAASRRFGEGDLTQRVPVRGRDELAELARSFNRMADSLQAGEERQRRLVADVAHELRTPLANLRGYLEALKDGVLPADPELFANLHREAVLQQRIVDDLQDLALAEAGTLAYHRTTVDLAELLETCYTAHQAAVETAGVDLRMRTDRDLLVDADPDRLRQVVGNLVSNALRATAPGGSITLGGSATDATATVVVRDTGVGIAAEDLPHIFDRFWRADGARGRASGGRGLGLAIARQIVTDHDGHIAAESRPGEGTTVTITLPLLAPPHPHP
jgi:two-component system, OmpR family, sensor histidine kinase BaeS